MVADGPPAIFLMGPTATGKTGLAVELVQILPCEIISVDSVMIYRGMDIGTAKPDRETLELAPHRLIDILDPSCAYSAARFREDALREMEVVTSAGRIPLLVGGTMLYFRALEHGLTRLPAANLKVRARLEEEAKSIGWIGLHKRLAAIDPEAAERIHPRDPQRVQRALEVFELTGQPLSAHYRCGQAEALPYKLIKISLIPARREHLRDRIAKRFQKMLEQGLITEVESLYKRGDLKDAMPSIRAVGYRQVWDYLQGRLDYASMVIKAIVATRQLAKRQLTWMRSIQDTQQIIAEQCSPSSVAEKICAHLD